MKSQAKKKKKRKEKLVFTIRFYVTNIDSYACACEKKGNSRGIYFNFIVSIVTLEQKDVRYNGENGNRGKKTSY